MNFDRLPRPTPETRLSPLAVEILAGAEYGDLQRVCEVIEELDHDQAFAIVVTLVGALLSTWSNLAVISELPPSEVPSVAKMIQELGLQIARANEEAV